MPLSATWRPQIESEDISMALCPSCDAPVLRAVIQEVPIGGLFSEQWRGITYSCPSCQHVLSVAIDPIAIKSDIVDEILTALGKR